MLIVVSSHHGIDDKPIRPNIVNILITDGRLSADIQLQTPALEMAVERVYLNLLPATVTTARTIQMCIHGVAFRRRAAWLDPG